MAVSRVVLVLLLAVSLAACGKTAKPSRASGAAMPIDSFTLTQLQRDKKLHASVVAAKGHADPKLKPLAKTLASRYVADYGNQGKDFADIQGECLYALQRVKASQGLIGEWNDAAQEKR